jgi:hypothetical protein
MIIAARWKALLGGSGQRERAHTPMDWRVNSSPLLVCEGQHRGSIPQVTAQPSTAHK